MEKPEPITIARSRIAPGTRARVEVPIPDLVTGADASLPVEVIHGQHTGPRLLLCATIHGDEINGVEIIRRVARRVVEERQHGIVADPMGRGERDVCAPHPGVVIGRTELPLVHEGGALFHVASFDRPEQVAGRVAAFHDSLARTEMV